MLVGLGASWSLLVVFRIYIHLLSVHRKPVSKCMNSLKQESWTNCPLFLSAAGMEEPSGGSPTGGVARKTFSCFRFKNEGVFEGGSADHGPYGAAR